MRSVMCEGVVFGDWLYTSVKVTPSPARRASMVGLVLCRRQAATEGLG